MVRPRHLWYQSIAKWGVLTLSDEPLDCGISLPFPIEFVIRDTPRSHQSANTRGKNTWKRKVGLLAGAHVQTLKDFFYIDRRPLAVTVFYFAPAEMDGDIDNIVKLIADGMTTIIYPDDRLLERIVVKKFEPGIEFVFLSPTRTLEQVVGTHPPVIYIRIDDDLS